MDQTRASPEFLRTPEDDTVIDGLTRAQWRRVQEVFAGARETAPEGRQAWLAAASGTEEWLRQEVESLLAFAPVEASPAPSEMPARIRTGQLLGRGGFSDVYAAVDEQWGAVAVKRLRILNGEALLQFKSEFRLVKERLSGCPHVIRLHELLEHGSEWLLLMERLEGETLRDRLDR